MYTKENGKQVGLFLKEINFSIKFVILILFRKMVGCVICLATFRFSTQKKTARNGARKKYKSPQKFEKLFLVRIVSV